MKIFISYSSEDRAIADALAIGLRQNGHTVFFDRDNLPPGEEYHARIRGEIADCHLFIFLITPASVRPSCYAMSELTLVRQRWPDPTGRILPVLAQATPQADIPAYLTAVTYVQAAGNLTAETLAAVANIIRDRRRRIRVVLIVVGAALFAVGSIYRIWQMPPPAESKSCYLAAQIATKSGAGTLGTGLIIDVNYQGETSSFMVSPDGTASIHLGPLTVTNDIWKLEVRSPAGEPISGQTVQGCPSVARTFALGKDLNVTLVPR